MWKELLDEKKVSRIKRYELARALNVSEAAVARWRSGEGDKALSKWANLLKQENIKDIPTVKVSTLSLVGKKAMRKAGYSSHTINDSWVKGDPRHIQNYKKAYHHLKKIRKHDCTYQRECPIDCKKKLASGPACKSANTGERPVEDTVQ